MVTWCPSHFTPQGNSPQCNWRGDCVDPTASLDIWRRQECFVTAWSWNQIS